jgi:hypothetical protein
MSELKTKPTDESVSDFLDNIGDETRRKDCYAVLDMMREATRVEPVMWGTSIIGFGRYRYRYSSGHEGEWPIIAFSPRRNDLTLYLIPGFAEFSDLLSKLGKYKTGKSCLYLKKLDQVDRDVLKELIEESVAAMEDQRVDV